MPEGDTLHTLARAMRPGLETQTVERMRLRGQSPEWGEAPRVERVYAHGKHLFLEFSHGRTLRCHLGMHGDWHRYPVGVVWKKPARQASVVIETARQVYVCFNAKEAEWMPTDGIRRRTLAARIGPDLLGAGIRWDRLEQRLLAFSEGHTPLCDLLLDQRIASGIGNVYKSEILFLHHRHPMTVRGQVEAGELVNLYRSARSLLQSNLRGGQRVTRFVSDARGGLWVYGRRREPCFVCGGPIRSQAMGHHLRPTYWCSACQPE